MTRIEKLMQSIPGAALVETGPNRAWLLDFPSSAGTALLTKKEAIFVVDFRYIEAAEKTVKDARVVLQESDPDAQIKALLKASGESTVFIENQSTIARLAQLEKAMPEISFVADETLSDLLQELRSVKDSREVDAIRSAQAITDAAFTALLPFIKPGISERAVAAKLEYLMKEFGAEKTAFDSIVISGPNSALPHGVPTDRLLQEGEFLLLDYGAVKNGYCSDMTRTVAVGSATEEMRKVYEVVLRAQSAAIRAARAGLTGKELDAVARDLIEEAGYGPFFGHGLGHSLGREIHEDPRASSRSESILEEQVIMTIEPGIYLPGKFGVRIENMVLLTEDGNENLTNSPTELIIV